MSGGHFDYDQYRIGRIAESIEKEIDKKLKNKIKRNNRRRVFKFTELGMMLFARISK